MLPCISSVYCTHVFHFFASLTSPQHSWIAGLSLIHIFETLKIFVRWAEEGWYDFCSIPYGAKMPMSLPDEDAIRQIPQHYEGQETTNEIRMLHRSVGIVTPV